MKEKLYFSERSSIISYNSLYFAKMKKSPLIEKLERYRLENRISEERLAKMLGVHYSTVHRWFNGAHPNKIQRYHITKLLGIRKKGKLEEILEKEQKSYYQTKLC